MDELTFIPQELAITKFDEPYLLLFRTYFMPDGTNGGKIVVFATTDDLRKLFQAEVLIADGTFKIKPRPFERIRGAQVFTLNTFVGDYPSTRMYPRLFALLPSKSERCYHTFLEMTLQAAVRDRGLDLARPGSIRWSYLMCDFELGIHNAFLDIAINLLHLAGLILELCHMHYCSAIIAHIKMLGLAAAYTDEKSGFQHVVSKLFALPFLPHDRIVEVYSFIVSEKLSDGMREDVAVQQFFEYYESTYITNPRFSLECLSVFDRSDASKRTTNDLEGKHRFLLDFWITEYINSYSHLC